MRGLKSLLWLTLLFLVILAIVIPGVWFYTAATLPNRIESAEDIELALRTSVESARQAVQAPLHHSVRKQVKWEHPELTQYPERVTNSFIGATGCPTYFKTPAETGAKYFKRELIKLFQHRDVMGDGACELILSRMLARKLEAATEMQVAVAADRVHSYLSKEQLVTYVLATQYFDDGIIGVHEASRSLMQKELADLTDAEVSEFQLALPPLGYWEELWECRNAGLIRESRDKLLNRLAHQGLLSEAIAREAASQPVRCLAVKR